MKKEEEPDAAGSGARRIDRGFAPNPPDLQLNPRGVSYKPLGDHDIERIHHAALDVLEKIGVADPIPELLEIATDHGAFADSDGRLRFPRSLIEDVIGKLFLSEPLVDLYDFTRLSDQLEHIHSIGQPFIATEYSEDLLVHDINVAYAQRAGTHKSFGLGIGRVDHIEPLIGLLDIFAGGEGEFLKDPFFSFGGCPIVSPLRFAKGSTEVMIKCAQMGVYYDVAVASQAGATAPAALAGSLVQTFAESLALR